MKIFPSGEIAERALTMFLVMLLVIRITGMRSFRKNNPFDLVMAFLVGGIISRGVVGATPYFSALAGAITLLILHKIFSRLSLYSKSFEFAYKRRKNANICPRQIHS